MMSEYKVILYFMFAMLVVVSSAIFVDQFNKLGFKTQNISLICMCIFGVLILILIYV